MSRSCFLAGASLAALSAVAALCAPGTAHAADRDPTLVDVIVVTGARDKTSATLIETPALRPLEGPDASAVLMRVPGAARIGNGALSGQAQYRGLFGPRLNLRVDGQRFGSGGPNLMDPPLHYAPLALVDTIEVDRGVSPVRHGPGLAGGADAVFKRVDFASGASWTPHADLTGTARSADASYTLGGIAGAATHGLRFNLLGTHEDGDDTEFPGGTIASSRFERTVYGFSGGARSGGQEIGLDLRRQETGTTGNPPFPMDIRYFDTDFARLSYDAQLGGMRIETGASFAQVDHAMTNFHLRPPPAMAAMYRESLAEATTAAGQAAAIFEVPEGELRVGIDFERIERNSLITNPNNASFFIRSLPDIETRRGGLHAEWAGRLGPLNAEIGARADRHEDEAGLAATGPAVPTGPAMLAAAFNAADRSADETTFDAVLRAWFTPTEGRTLRLTLARKTRVPSYLERFAWLPTEASGGLADGNVYVGDLGLEPETAWIAETGIDWSSDDFYLRPTVYYRRIDNYIQGVPFDATVGIIDTPQEMVASMNGDPTPLRFANVDAELYGFDVDGGTALGAGWRVDAVASYVRGKRRDVDDNLYRIAPPSVTAGLTYEAALWSATLETRLVAEQDEISRTNSERETGGYGLLNLHAQVNPRDGVRLSAGIENLLDTEYEDHLSGYNRVSGSDVAPGARLPGAGLSAFVRINVFR